MLLRPNEAALGLRGHVKPRAHQREWLIFEQRKLQKQTFLEKRHSLQPMYHLQLVHVAINDPNLCL
jgi:hypothetical protein